MASIDNFKELMKVIPHHYRLNLLKGEIKIMPVKKRPYLLHKLAFGTRITATLLDDFCSSQGGFTLPTAPPTVLCPDASVVLSTRWNTLPPNEQEEAFPALAPNFVVEMSDSESFVHDKMCTWIDAGVEE
ncbi:505_t:CDS:2, partial [Paraglomus occultum]